MSAWSRRGDPMNQTATAILGLLAFVALALVQSNLAWATDQEGGEERTARTWGETSSGGFGFFSYSENRGWYDGGWDDDAKAAVGQLQVAAPLLLAGTVVLLAGSLLAFRGDSPAASITTLVGGVLAAAGTLLYFIAIGDLYGGGPAWQAGFFLAFTGCLLGVAGGVIGLAARNLSRTAT